ncbi:hypothetical protein B0H21DRAFT_712080 [Amylocystis lapponica]|nr:hypothetical protein B0H21DRAFT_712080 [Amylocystis lapponica]
MTSWWSDADDSCPQRSFVKLFFVSSTAPCKPLNDPSAGIHGQDARMSIYGEDPVLRAHPVIRMPGAVISSSARGIGLAYSSLSVSMQRKLASTNSSQALYLSATSSGDIMQLFLDRSSAASQQFPYDPGSAAHLWNIYGSPCHCCWFAVSDQGKGFGRPTSVSDDAPLPLGVVLLPLFSTGFLQFANILMSTSGVEVILDWLIDCLCCPIYYNRASLSVQDMTGSPTGPYFVEHNQVCLSSSPLFHRRSHLKPYEISAAEAPAAQQSKDFKGLPRDEVSTMACQDLIEVMYEDYTFLAWSPGLYGKVFIKRGHAVGVCSGRSTWTVRMNRRLERDLHLLGLVYQLDAEFSFLFDAHSLPWCTMMRHALASIVGYQPRSQDAISESDNDGHPSVFMVQSKPEACIDLELHIDFESIRRKSASERERHRPRSYRQYIRKRRREVHRGHMGRILTSPRRMYLGDLRRDGMYLSDSP